MEDRHLHLQRLKSKRELAATLRRVAATVSLRADRERLMEHADELEREAAALEARTASGQL
jgi:hypothetical protein